MVRTTTTKEKTVITNEDKFRNLAERLVETTRLCRGCEWEVTPGEYVELLTSLEREAVELLESTPMAPTPVCDTCSNEHPTVTHDSDCERWLGIDGGECICGDNVVGPSGYVSVPTECIDSATN